MTKGINRQQLNAIFTPYIQNALAEGFAVSFLDGIRGSFSNVWGEQMHLSKGDEHIVMWLERDHFHQRREVAEVRVRVARFVYDGDVNLTWPKDWEPHLVHEERWYAVADGYDGGDWFVPAEEAETVQAKKDARRRANRNRYGCYYIPMTDRMLKAVRKVPGFKTVKREIVTVERRYADDPGVRYTITNTKSRNQVTVSF